MGKATSSSHGLGRSLSALGKIAAVGVGAAFAGLAVALKVGFDELADGQKVAAQTGAVLKSTGGAANVTAKQVDDLANSLSRMSGIDDEVIASGENMLLTFTNIHDEVGRGNDIFTQSTKVLLDMSTALGTDMNKSAIQLGKALNDPIKGVSALARVGVTFTEGQKKTIKSLVEGGKTMEAQKLILAELNKEFGGSAKAFGTTLPGQLSKLKNSFEEVASQVAAVFLPALNKGVAAAANFLQDLSQAKGFRAKLNVVWTNIKEAGMKIETALRQAFAGIDWSAVWAGATGIAAGMQAKLEQVDWEAVGASIITGLQTAIEKAGELAKSVADVITRAFQQINWAALGEVMAPGLITLLGTAFVTALDPSFWAHHWELALSIGIAAFSGVIGKFAGKLGLLVLGPLKGVGSEMVLAIAGGIERFSPRLAEAFLVAINFAGRAALAAFVAIGKHFESAVGGIFRKLGTVAREILQVGFALAAIEAVKALINGLVSNIGRLWAWLTGTRDKIKAAIQGWTGAIFAAASAIGRAIVDGVLSGMGNLFASVKDKIIGGVKGAIDAAMGVFGHSPQKAIGAALALEIIAGWEKDISGLKDSMKTKITEAIDAAKLAIDAKQGFFASAFDGLVSAATAAFDKLSSEFQTKTEKKITAQDEARAKRDRAQALKAAQSELAKAQSGVDFQAPEGESPQDAAARAKAQGQAIAEAEKAVAEALFQIKRASDEKIATQERKDYEAKRERQRLSLANRLSDLQASFLQGEITVTQFTARMAKILDKAGIPLKNAATQLGAALAAGLNEAKKDAVNAAKELAQAIINQLGNISVIVKVHVSSSRSGADDDKRAAGGPVKRGKQYLVGEQGPELFVPSASGKIVSNANLAAGGARALGGGGSMVFNFPNYVGDRRELEDAMQSIMLTYQRRNGFGFAG